MTPHPQYLSFAILVAVECVAEGAGRAGKMQEIVLGTTNEAKIADFLASGYFQNFQVYTLRDFAVPEVEETGTTLEENALLKARVIFNATHRPTLADDTGFFVHALGGFPGLFAARVAGPEKDFARVKADMRRKIAAAADKTAHFSTALAFVEGTREHVIRADVAGLFVYGDEPVKQDPNGYRDAFRPEGAPCTVSEMTIEQKARFSPRNKALTQLFQELGLLKALPR